MRERLSEDLSYSTVVTIVSRLHAKGLLERERTGRAFVYRPVDDASRAASQMSQALAAGSDHGAVLSRFVSGLSGRDARLLRNLLGEPGGALPGDAGACPANPGTSRWTARLPAAAGSRASRGGGPSAGGAA